MKSESRSWKIAGMRNVEFLWDRHSFFYPHHVHEGFNIDFVQAGLIEYRIGVRSFLVRPGNLIWIDHHEVHCGRSIGKERLMIRSLFLSQSFVLALASELRIKKVDHLIDPIIDDENLLAQIGFIHRTAEQPSDVLEIETRLVETISTLLSRYATIRFSVREKCREHRAVNEVKEFMLIHYADRINLQRLADLVDLNISYLVRVFRSHVGLPPYTYLTEIRMARARELLSAGMAPAEVSAAVGLSDQSHLTRMFRRSSGMTPGSYARSRSVYCLQKDDQ